MLFHWELCRRPVPFGGTAVACETLTLFPRYIKARLEPDAAEDSAVNALKHELDETKRKLEALQIQHDHIRSQITKGEVEEAVVAEPI